MNQEMKIIARVVKVGQTRNINIFEHKGQLVELMEISQNDGCLCGWSPLTLEHFTDRIKDLNLRPGEEVEMIIRKTQLGVMLQ